MSLCGFRRVRYSRDRFCRMLSSSPSPLVGTCSFSAIGSCTCCSSPVWNVFCIQEMNSDFCPGFPPARLSSRLSEIRALAPRDSASWPASFFATCPTRGYRTLSSECPWNSSECCCLFFLDFWLPSPWASCFATEPRSSAL